MDEDGKIAAAAADGEECEEPTAEPKPFNKDRLVLYHWTQSFASQKVRVERGREEAGRREEEKRGRGWLKMEVSFLTPLRMMCRSAIVFSSTNVPNATNVRAERAQLFSHMHGNVGV